MSDKPQQVNVNHGCGCGGLIGFLLVIGLIAAAAEDIGRNPGPWIIGGIVALVVGGIAFYVYAESKGGPAEAVGGVAQKLTPAPADKVCPACAETVKGAAQVCRYCGHRFDGAAKAKRKHR